MRKLWLAMFAFVVIATLANAQSYTVLYNFGTQPGDPVIPQLSTITQGRDGNLYSAFPFGGGTGHYGLRFGLPPRAN
jgi:hypothetical protein